jgi:hypothetical protein
MGGQEWVQGVNQPPLALADEGMRGYPHGFRRELRRGDECARPGFSSHACGFGRCRRRLAFAERRSRNQRRATAILAVLGHGRDARGRSRAGTSGAGPRPNAVRPYVLLRDPSSASYLSTFSPGRRLEIKPPSPRGEGGGHAPPGEGSPRQPITTCWRLRRPVPPW